MVGEDGHRACVEARKRRSPVVEGREPGSCCTDFQLIQCPRWLCLLSSPGSGLRTTLEISATTAATTSICCGTATACCRRVHRLQYEDLVSDFEGEVRRLPAYCGLPFEEAVPALLRD